VILDTNAISAFADGDRGVRGHLQNLSATIHVPVIVLGEYRYGLNRRAIGSLGKNGSTNWKRVLPF
jgi:predicted nucleic acid-binding protein